MGGWTVRNSKSAYQIDRWGEGYFAILQNGTIEVRPSRTEPGLNLLELVTTLSERGIHPPVLLRFDGIIEDRLQRLYAAFAAARNEAGYESGFVEVYPLKVNQQRHVVEAIQEAGRKFTLGIEVGSKPELVAVVSIHDTPGSLLLCNGYKDSEYIELALLARKLGRRSIIIIEQPSELETVIKVSDRLGIEPEIGVRMKLMMRGSGHWETSGGEKAKFGLTPAQISELIQSLKQNKRDHWLKLVHFHAGSQMTEIRSIGRVLREASRMFAEIAALCPSVSFFDVGGGLAVDYDGSRSSETSSMDYSLEEYARNVIYAILEACQAKGVRQPDIITEAGRAVVAHHAVLVTQAIERPIVAAPMKEEPPRGRFGKEFASLYKDASPSNALEVVHDALMLREDAFEAFLSGTVSLEERAESERGFWSLQTKLAEVAAIMESPPQALLDFVAQRKDTYFCNFSVFQSIPDAWAIDQIFPIVPIQRLNEEPSRLALLADMSCDSDGKIDHFIGGPLLRVHELRSGEPYYLGVFLVGAYQEILGDLHNLFGDTNAVHVKAAPDGQASLSHIVEGDTVREALAYVQYDIDDLRESLRRSIERSVAAGTLSNQDAAAFSKRFREALEGYTYLYVTGD